jgi:CMP-N-acetylneuraminic acid synthetase
MGKPLLAHAIECAGTCETVDHIVVSTDSDEIAAVAEAWGQPVPFRRPPEIASDSAAKIEAIRHATLWVEAHEGFFPDLVVDLDVGAPLRVPEDITACIESLAGNSELDALVSVYEAERNPYFNMVELDGQRARLVKQAPQPLVCRQDAPAVYSVSGSVFAFRRSALMRVTHLYEGRWGACIIPRERAIDIDFETDFKLAEVLARQQTGGAG